MPAQDREDSAIAAWINALEVIEKARLRVLDWPDRRQPGRGGCDAIVERNGLELAVEHTTIHPYLGRMEDDARFRAVVVPLEKAIPPFFADSWIEIGIPANAIPTGERWEALRDRLIVRVREAVAAMPLADPSDVSMKCYELPGIPFPVWISRQDRAENDPACLVLRGRPSDAAEQLVADLQRALTEKSATLQPYGDQKDTVLLLDFDDQALLNEHTVAHAFSLAARSLRTPELITEVYLIDRRRKRRIWVLPVKRSAGLYPDLPEYEHFRRENFRLTWGKLPSW